MFNVGEKVKINFDNLRGNRGDINRLKEKWGESEKTITNTFTSYAGFVCYSFEGLRGIGFTKDELLKA